MLATKVNIERQIPLGYHLYMESENAEPTEAEVRLVVTRGRVREPGEMLTEMYTVAARRKIMKI